MDQEKIKSIISETDKLRLVGPGSIFFGCQVKTTPLLSDNEIVVKQGNEIFVCPGFIMPSTLRWIVIPTIEEALKEQRFAFEPPRQSFIDVYWNASGIKIWTEHL